jgi:hypothetical protein
MSRRSVRKVDRRDPIWPEQLTVLIAIGLGFALPRHLTIGAPWIVPAAEILLLTVLAVTTPLARRRGEELPRHLRMSLVGLVSLVNVIALVILVGALIDNSDVDGRQLLLGGVVLWLTGVLLFGCWFWELDRGGPVRRMHGDDGSADFLFPPMTDDKWSPTAWVPRFSDYLYLSLTNAASFSSAETMPLTRTAKALMAIQALASLTTMLIVLAYAVNNLN